MSNFIGFGIGLCLVGFSILKGIVSPSIKKGQLKRKVGLRKIGTAEGVWRNAYMAGEDYDGNITAAIFEDGMDYIGHPQSWDEVELMMKKLVEKEGYRPMTESDMYLTGGASY